MRNGSFKTRVLSVVRRIPPGRVATYGDVAAVAGRAGAARAVGNIMRDCGGRDVPAHRVVAAAGRLGGYGGNVALKRELLKAEGVLVSGLRIRDFKEKRWKASRWTGTAAKPRRRAPSKPSLRTRPATEPRRAPGNP
jgi:O-6-methylguanine DNA methyltransferase